MYAVVKMGITRHPILAKTGRTSASGAAAAPVAGTETEVITAGSRTIRYTGRRSHSGASRHLIPAALLDEGDHPRAYFVADRAYLVQRPALGVEQRPVVRFQPRHIGTLLAASHRDEQRRVSGEILGELLRPVAAQVDA